MRFQIDLITRTLVTIIAQNGTDFKTVISYLIGSRLLKLQARHSAVIKMVYNFGISTSKIITFR